MLNIADDDDDDDDDCRHHLIAKLHHSNTSSSLRCCCCCGCYRLQQRRSLLEKYTTELRAHTQRHNLTKNDTHNRSNHVFFITSTSPSDKERHSQQIEPRVLHHVNITIWQRTTFTTDQTTCSSSATVRVDICSSRQTDVDSHSSWLLLATTLLTNYHSLMSSNYYRTWSLMSQGCSRWLWWKSGFHLVVTLTANVVIRPVLSLTALKF